MASSSSSSSQPNNAAVLQIAKKMEADELKVDRRVRNSFGCMMGLVYDSIRTKNRMIAEVIREPSYPEEQHAAEYDYLYDQLEIDQNIHWKLKHILEETIKSTGVKRDRFKTIKELNGV